MDNDFIQTRRINERKNVEQLRDELPELHLHEVELKDTDIHGLDLLRTISSELHGEISISEGLGPFSVGLGLEVHRGTWPQGNDVLLHLPGIVREDLSLRSESGTVYVGINSREHPVPFDRPAKASQVKAKLENDILKLTFPEE